MDIADQKLIEKARPTEVEGLIEVSAYSYSSGHSLAPRRATAGLRTICRPAFAKRRADDATASVMVTDLAAGGVQ